MTARTAHHGKIGESSRLGASPPEALGKLRDDVGNDIFGVYGIPSSIHGTGGSARESYRQFLASTIQPLAKMVIEELADKLDTPSLALDFSELRAADIATRARAYKQLIDSGMSPAKAEAVTGLGLMAVRNRIIDLQEPVVARDSFGGEITTWTTQATVWAGFENVGKNTERYIQDASKTHVVRMGRYEIRRPTVNFNELWRIVDGGGRVWDVVGIDKVSIRSNWGVTVKASGEILPPPEPDAEAKGVEGDVDPKPDELPKRPY